MTLNQSNNKKQSTDYDVAIVGCGPTGATLANLLSQLGISVLILDRESDIYPLPRAVHFDDETMRVFQTAGIADELLQYVRVNPGMQFVDENGELLLDWPRPAGIGKQGWHTSYRLHQPDLESLLRASLLHQKNCTLRLGAELIDLVQDDTSVRLRYVDKSSAQTISCSAKFLVGCDGANSSVRAHMHSTMEDLGFNERWLVVDVLLKHDIPELGDHTLQFCSATQAMTYCRNPGLRRRWEMALPASLSDEQAIDPDRIWALLSRWISPQQAVLERKAIYTFRSALAHQWRVNRLFIAGDAAHLTPPFMGQGMCTGIRDATNLAWKLSMVVNGQCDDLLLDSYQDERRPHAKEYIATAIRLGAVINSLEREGVMSIASTEESSDTRMASIAPKLGLSSALFASNSDSPFVGTLIDQVVFRNGVRFDDLCGYRPVLIVKQVDGSVSVKIIGKEELVLCKEDERSLVLMLDTMNVNAVLVRPDRYILSTAQLEDDVRALRWKDFFR